MVGVKSDVLSGLLTSPNLGIEVALSPRFTVEASVHYNGVDLGNDKRWKHWFVQPELRYWMCQPFGGHFFGVHALYGWYNVAGVKLRVTRGSTCGSYLLLAIGVLQGK